MIMIGMLMGPQSARNSDEYVIHTFEKIRFSSEFYAEGAGIGDLNGNGIPDVVCGPYWYEGRDFTDRHAFYQPKEFDPLEYSDNFVVEVADLNRNGRNDILVAGFPGQEAFWYENPGNADAFWPRHLIHSEVGNESPLFVDITGDSVPELVFNTGGRLGYATINPGNPESPWTFNPVSEPMDFGPFTHGLGVGDITGNGYPDFIMAGGWWEHPGEGLKGDMPWDYHKADFGTGGAQMYLNDIDRDGQNDVVTSLNAHGWGLAWYRQVRNEGEIHFDKNIIMGDSHDDNPYGVRFSQPHAVALADLNIDGINDLMSGKRWWAHGPDGDPEPNAPAVLYWFKSHYDEDDNVNFIPYQIDDDSGVGVEIATGDLSGNGYPDIVICNKKGGFVFLNRPKEVSREEWEEAQPKRIN